MLLVDRIRETLPIESMFFTANISTQHRKHYLDEVEQYDPDWIVSTKEEALALLNKLHANHKH